MSLSSCTLFGWRTVLSFAFWLDFLNALKDLQCLVLRVFAVEIVFFNSTLIIGSQHSLVARSGCHCLYPNAFPLLDYVTVQILWKEHNMISHVSHSSWWYAKCASYTYTEVKLAFLTAGEKLFAILMPAARCQTVLDAMIHFYSQFAGLHIPDPQVRARILRSANDQVVVVRTPGEERGGWRVPVQRVPDFALKRERIHVPDFDVRILRASG